jgi:Ni,Fe-hydrogenase III large subunit
MTALLLSDGTCGLDAVPCCDPDTFRNHVVAACRMGARLIATTVLPLRGQDALLAILAHDRPSSVEAVAMALPPERRYLSLSADLPQAQAFERELAEAHGLVPVGHPWPKPLRRHADLESPGSPDLHPFFHLEGAGVHEVAVGPVHAGIIEPGHFRFQTYGETVHSLEIQLGYQTRGAEKLLLSSPPLRRQIVAESVAGDTSIGHGLAYAIAIEKLAGMAVPVQAHVLRALALELERMDSHTGDLGALCNDVGYLPGASWYGRLRGDFLNLLVELSGNRFGRGLITTGGVRLGLPGSELGGFVTRFTSAVADFESIAEVIFDAPSVVSRFERTGALGQEEADELGLVGPVARACGCDRDARRDHPEGVYRRVPVQVALGSTGDVMARAEVRRAEVGHSATFIRTLLAGLADGDRVEPTPGRLQPSRLAVAMVEGWRGEIVHVATTSETGELATYKIVDPSFHNWFGLAMALRGQQISDFPLCNKSFDLSYAGHDL